MQIKIRYTFKNNITNQIFQKVLDVSQIETNLFSHAEWKNSSVWEVIGRDLWTGLQDVTKTDIYTNDIVVTPKGVSKVILLNGGFRAPIPGSNYRLSGWIHSTNSVEKIGDIYTTPELIEK